MNLQSLDFMVSLIDRVSGPVGKVMTSIDKMTTRAQAGYQKIGYGIAGVAGAGYAFDRITQPAKDMTQALAEVGTLDVAGDTLNRLRDTALKFSVQFGDSATDFVRSAYDIKGAIDSLQGDELSTFTRAAAVVAKGTKAPVQDITKYFGTMYGIFQDTAETMGKSQWIEQLAGQTAMAVKIFKTDGAGISQAFSTLGAEAQAANVSAAEQFGVLGKLMATMEGGEAGTKYRAFLHGVGKAQKELGLTFTDSSGRLLPMVEILNRINGKFGDLGKVATADLIKKAFGSDEAVALVKLLAGDVAGLNDSIQQIGATRGMDNAIKMAEQMAMPWDRAARSLEAIQIIIGSHLLPVFNYLGDRMQAVADTLTRWNRLFPELTAVLSYAVGGVLALVAGVSLLSIGAGVFSLMSAGLSIMSWPLLAVVAGVTAVGYGLYKMIQYWPQIRMAASDAIERVITVVNGWMDTLLAIPGRIADTVMSSIQAIYDGITGIGRGLMEIFGNAIDWVIGKFAQLASYVSGFSFSGFSMPSINAPAPINAPNTGGGGLLKQITSSTSNTKQLGPVTINNYESRKPLSQLVDEVMMAGG